MTTCITYPSFSISEIGKLMKHSKIEHNWTFGLNIPITITLLYSRISGKRRVILNAKQVYYQRAFCLFTYTFIYHEHTFCIVEHAPENFELYIDKEPISKYIDTPAMNYNERMCEISSINSRKGMYLELVSNDDYCSNKNHKIQIDNLSPDRSNSNKENNLPSEVNIIKKTHSDSAHTRDANKIEELFK
jgi:hypothetical protein